MDYVTPIDRQLTVYGKALVAGSTSPLLADGFQDEALLVVELLRHGYLNSNRLNLIPSPSIPQDLHSKQLTLLSRVFTLLSMRFRPDKAWEGEIDQDLMAFNSIVKALHRSLRNLFEMVTLSIFLRHKSIVAPSQYAPLSARLPFLQESNTALGIVFKAFIFNQHLRNAAGLSAAFPSCLCPFDDILKAFRFWHQVLRIVKNMKLQNLITQELFDEFQSANAFLAERLASPM